MNMKIPAWMEIAEKELGQKEIKGKENNPRIVEYHKSTSLLASDDETPWCSSFINWCIKSAGLKGTNRANARSWLKWGYMHTYPVYGSIVVLKRGKYAWQGHVGFYINEDKKFVYILGGNQGDKVSIAKYNKKDVLGYRLP